MYKWLLRVQRTYFILSLTSYITYRPSIVPILSLPFITIRKFTFRMKIRHCWKLKENFPKSENIIYNFRLYKKSDVLSAKKKKEKKKGKRIRWQSFVYVWFVVTNNFETDRIFFYMDDIQQYYSRKSNNVSL